MGGGDLAEISHNVVTQLPVSLRVPLNLSSVLPGSPLSYK